MGVLSPVFKRFWRSAQLDLEALAASRERDARAASAAQARLAFPPLPKFRDLEMGVWYEPARVLSGDFYDVVPLDDTRLAFLVGDVAGKGAPAALIGASLQACLQTHLGLDASICRALHAVNAHVFARTAPHHFATLFLGVYDTRSGALRYVNCGHNPPLIVREGGGIERLDATATILGAFAHWHCATGTVGLRAGDLLLAFTDGLTECRDAALREFGEDGLLRAVDECRSQPVSEIIDSIAQAKRHFSDERCQDDVTLIAARASHREVNRA